MNGQMALRTIIQTGIQDNLIMRMEKKSVHKFTSNTQCPTLGLLILVVIICSISAKVNMVSGIIDQLEEFSMKPFLPY